MIYRSMVSLLVVAAWTTSGLCQEVRLERKFHEGASYTTEVSGGIDQTLTIAGMETETNVQTQTVSTARVGSRANDGSLRVAEKVESLQIAMGGTAGDYTYDSANPDNKGASAMEFLRPIHKALSNRTITMVYGKDNLVQAVETGENILASLPAQVQALVEGQLDPESLKKAANQQLASLPDKPVRKGETWERTEIANFGAGQLMTFEVTYTYDGTVQEGGKQLDRISMRVDSVEFELEENAALPIGLKDSDLKISESEGVILFDREAGRTVRSRQKTRITGDITFEANGQELPSKLDLTINADTKIKAN